MSEKVISLRTGAAVCAPGEVNAATVTELEKLLERARSGDIQSIAVGYLHGDNAVGCTYEGPITYSFIGKLVELTNYLVVERASNLGV